MRENQPTMSLNDGRDDAVLVGVFVSRSWSFDRAERIVAGGAVNGLNASVDDRFEERSFGCRGFALYIITKLQRASISRAREPSLGEEHYQACHNSAYFVRLHANSIPSRI
jgi:hypothetical protein